MGSMISPLQIVFNAEVKDKKTKRWSKVLDVTEICEQNWCITKYAKLLKVFTILFSIFFCASICNFGLTITMGPC